MSKKDRKQCMKIKFPFEIFGDPFLDGVSTMIILVGGSMLFGIVFGSLWRLLNE